MKKIGQILMYMSRLAGAVLIALLAGSCASRPDRPPSDQANLCAIFAERPDWQDAVTASAKRWGAPVPVQMAILWKESGFRANAKPPKKHILGFIPWGRRSSAYGYPQAIDGTWDWYRDETGN
ncbi:MAG TPA: lytic transglycosylase, partial [Thermohalobaculum sp.]|nr:lytic transglycosylase [Thermohalobaculum sp.]